MDLLKHRKGVRDSLSDILLMAIQRVAFDAAPVAYRSISAATSSEFVSRT
jgi:hypothetical protein